TLGLVLLASSCAGIRGGQSGDDGDFSQPGTDPDVDPTPQPLPPGGPQVPPIDNCDGVDRELEPDAVTQCGISTDTLLAELGSTQLPLFWNNYATAQLKASYVPGPSETQLSLTLSMRDPSANPNPD